MSPASYRCSLLVLALLAGAAFAGDLPDSSDEYRVKALFLFNFAKFVEWPNALPGDGISIGILGDDPFGDMLAQTIAGKTVNGHGFIVRHVKPEQARQCQIVFVAASERKHVRAVLDAVAGSPVLTVGDMHGFAQAGGVIDFEIIDSKVRFEVNLEAAERARLKLSSKLLSLAKIVREGKE
ncbi:MAG TPA: YfiR family protein [Bryobacteraceae bacterium]|nr:YfiR family protein [Bryobacteraceae bacterium]